MSSGIGVSEECVTQYQDLKDNTNRRNPPPLKYIIFTLNSKYTEIVVEKTSTSSDWETFLGDLPENECRWAVYDFEYGENKSKKIVFIAWSPDTARIKQKMVSAASKEAFRKTLVGVGADIQASDISGITVDEVLKKVDPTGRSTRDDAAQ